MASSMDTNLMLIDVFQPEKGLVKPETVLPKPDENQNHDHDHSRTGERETHRHAECLKPYNPKTARRSTGRGPALQKTSVTSLTKYRPGQEMYSQDPNRLFAVPAADGDDQNEDPISSDSVPIRNNGGGVGPKINTGLGGQGNGDVRRQGSSVVRTGRVSTTVWKVGKPGSDAAPPDGKNISKEVPSKTWKAVRFSSTISRGSNTTTSICVTKSVQTVSTAYKLRLNRWPVWSSNFDSGYYRSSSILATSSEGYYYPLWTRRILSFIFSQFGIVLFLTTWISGHAALFQHLEQQPDIKLVNDVVSSRNELVITLATELRQVFPYEMAWRRKIDDYFIKFEASLNNATARGYSTHKRAFYKWDYLDFLLFSLQLVTGQGYGTDVPKTEWSLLLSIPCVLIGLPFMWLFLIDLGAKWADTLSNSIQQFRWNLARRYPDVVSLHADSSAALGTSRYLPPPPPQHLHQNGLERFSEEAPAIRPYQNGGRLPVSLLANGDAQDSRFFSQGTEENAATALRSVWTVEPVAVAMMPDAPLKAAKLSTADDMYHHATPWVATVFIVLYPFLGSLVFGFWANLPFTTSFVLPLTSLMLISPPAVFTSFLWRTMFHLYLLVGWVLLIACFLLWHQSWRDTIKNWAHDLSIKQYQKTYPLQVR